MNLKLEKPGGRLFVHIGGERKTEGGESRVLKGGKGVGEKRLLEAEVEVSEKKRI